MIFQHIQINSFLYFDNEHILNNFDCYHCILWNFLQYLNFQEKLWHLLKRNIINTFTFKHNQLQAKCKCQPNDKAFIAKSILFKSLNFQLFTDKAMHQNQTFSLVINVLLSTEVDVSVCCCKRLKTRSTRKMIKVEHI